jgi:hypothetical protein
VEVEEGCLGSQSAWTRSSPRLPPMAPAGGLGAGGEVRRGADGRRLDAQNTKQQTLYRRRHPAAQAGTGSGAAVAGTPCHGAAPGGTGRGDSRGAGP